MMVRVMLAANSKSVHCLFLCGALACLLAAYPLSGQTAAPAQSTATQQPETTRTAAQLLDQGLAAEQAGDWERALLDYTEGAALYPADRAIRVRLEVARFQVVQQRTERAERELLADRKDLAIASLRSALQLDPGYSVARDRLEQLEQQETFAGDLPPLPTASGPPQVAAEPGLRNFDYSGPTRGAYEEVARQFGLVATFDSDLTDRDIRFRVDAVDFRTAMDALEQLTGTFWISIDGRTFFVAADSIEKRNQYAPEITVSIPLPAAESTDDMTETTRVVRDITGIRRSTLNADAHTLTLRDTPDNIELARQLLRDIDQPRGELLLDIDILEVNRAAAERIGITPPSQANTFTLSTGQVRQLQDAENNGTLLQVLQGIFGAQNPLASGSNLSALLPPLLVFGGGNSTFLATLPGATADFSRTLSVIRQAQRVLLRVKDGQAGTLFVGERFPISLALLSESLVTGQSQFTPGLSPGTFPRADFPTGTSPAGVVTADFNGDGNLDLAVANQGANTVAILLGDGTGKFGDHTDFTTAAGPVALAAIDFDRDGNLDLAVADDTAGVISLLHGNGDGTFTAITSLPAGNSPVAILSQDLNKDGIADLIVANRSDNTVSVYLGHGDGTFATPQDFAVDTGPVAISAGDFDNDGNLDLAVANQTANTVSVLKGVGDGTFTTRTDFTAGQGPVALDIADFNGDGRPDLAVANQTDNTVSVFAGDGNGGFSTRTNLDTGGGPTALLAADFNADQVPDLVTANQQDNTVSVFLSLNNGSFTPQLVLPVGNAPVALAAGDLNGDNRPDLIASDRASNSVTVTLNTTTIPVSPNAPLTSYPASQYLDLGLKVSATPRIHPGEEVTLRLQFEISALSGRNVNGIPIIGDRVVDQVVRLRENETSVLAGLMQSNELHGITGADPWGLLTGTLASRNTNDTDTEMLIVITPRQIRLGPRPGRTLYAGRGEGPIAPPQPIAVPGPGQPGPPPVPGQPQPVGAPTEPGGAPQPLQLPPAPAVVPNALPPDTEAPPPPPPAGAFQGPG
jgi:FG-GAP-like repeat/Bacterial type II and III secretion system protein